MTSPILHVLWSLEGGGAERAVYQLVREQRRRGWHADVMVASCAGFYGAQVRESGAQVHELGQRRGFDPTIAARAARIFARYPLAHFHGREPLLVTVATRRKGPRLLYTHRGGNLHYPLRKRLRHEIIGYHLRRDFDAISANTQQSAKAAAHIFRLPLGSIQVVYNGLDFALLQPDRPRADVLEELGDPQVGAVRVGTVAVLRGLKRVNRLLEAVAVLRNDPIHCYIIGDGPARAELERLAERLDIVDCVTFAGSKSHIGNYLQVLDVFVLPSGPEEAFGNAVVEAMGMGLPSIIFRDGGGLTEHIDDADTGFVVSDQRGLEQRLRELIHDRELRLRIGKAASTAVRTRYTVDAMMSGYETLYESITD